MIMNKKYYNVVCAIIKKEDKILCVQRKDKGEVGLKWEFPGGKIETGETIENAIIREIKEELNCNIKPIKYLGNIYHEYNTFNITLHAVICEMLDDFFELKEHLNSRWVNIDEIYSLDLAEADCKLLKFLDLNNNKLINNEVIKRIRKFTKDRNWEQFYTGENLAKSLVLEAAELLELYQWNKEVKDIERLKEELADVLIYSLMIADKYNLNIEEIIMSKMDKNEKKYPVEKAYGKSDKYNEL